MNGKSGRVVSYIPDSARYAVRVGNDTIALMPVNLILPPQTRVIIKGLEGAKKWNDHVGTVLGYDPAEGRYRVKVRYFYNI